MFSNTSDLDLRLVRIFLAVADARGVTAAESFLGMRQSAISAQLSLLECRVGFRLCERGRGGFRLTSKGERFVALARTLTHATAEFATQVQALDRKLVGRLSIGLIGQMPPQEETRIASALTRFRMRDQAVRLVMSNAAPRELEKGLIDNQLDLAIGYFWRQCPRLVYVPLFSESQDIYCGRDHPLFQASSPPLSQVLESHEWVSRTYPLPLPEALAQCRISATADSIEAAQILVLSGSHLGYLPCHHAGPLQQQGRLKALAPAALRLTLTMHLVLRREAVNRPIIQAFLGDIAGVFRLDMPSPELPASKHSV